MVTQILFMSFYQAYFSQPGNAALLAKYLHQTVISAFKQRSSF